MKKFLSILGSVGLIALGSTSVVSCVIKQPAKPTFRNMKSIDSSSWNLNGKQFLKTDIIEVGKTDPVKNNLYLFYAIQNDFKNPEAVADFFEKNEVEYKVNDSQPVIDKDGKILYNNVTISLLYKQSSNAANKIVGAKGLSLKTFEGKERLKLVADEDNITATDTDISLNYNESKEIFTQIVEFANDYKNIYDKENYPPKFIHDSMWKLNSVAKNVLVANLSQKFLPSYRDKDGKLVKFNESIGEQLSYIKGSYYSAFDDQILTEVVKLVAAGNDINLGAIQGIFTSLNLANFKLNFEPNPPKPTL